MAIFESLRIVERHLDQRRSSAVTAKRKSIWPTKLLNYTLWHSLSRCPEHMYMIICLDDLMRKETLPFQTLTEEIKPLNWASYEIAFQENAVNIEFCGLFDKSKFPLQAPNSWWCTSVVSCKHSIVWSDLDGKISVTGISRKIKTEIFWNFRLIRYPMCWRKSNTFKFYFCNQLENCLLKTRGKFGPLIEQIMQGNKGTSRETLCLQTLGLFGLSRYSYKTQNAFDWNCSSSRNRLIGTLMEVMQLVVIAKIGLNIAENPY